MKYPAPAMITAFSCLWVGAVAAQEAPPQAPHSDSYSSAVTEAETRPPEKPLDDDTPQESDDPGGQKTAPTVATEPKDEIFGPPAPPKWFVQRENDLDYAACKLALSFLGTVYSEENQLTDPDNPECGIARPIRVQRILPDLTLEGGVVMRCDTARALGFWARDFLRPASARLPDAPRVTRLQLGTTYDCRGRVGIDGDAPKLSEHAFGNAIDIMGFVFDNGEILPVEPRVDTGQLTEAFQKAVRHSGCLFFTTVLGPGSNAAHDDHLHFDVAVRKGGWRLCE